MNTKPQPYEVEVPYVTSDNESDNELKAYIGIARQINFLPQALCGILRSQVLAFFKERRVGLFDYQEVHLHLVRAAWRLWEGAESAYHEPRQVPLWCWRPLRDQDRSLFGWNVTIPRVLGYKWTNGREYSVNKSWELAFEYTREKFTRKMLLGSSRVALHGFYDPANSACIPYEKLVPLRVISRVLELEKEVETQFVGKVRFFVSDFDYNVVYADPFIAVKIGYSRSHDDLLIFDCWDEPGFSG